MENLGLLYWAGVQIQVQSNALLCILRIEVKWSVVPRSVLKFSEVKCNIVQCSEVDESNAANGCLSQTCQQRKSKTDN